MATQLPTARGCRCELGRGKSRRICPSWGAAAGIREGAGGPSSPSAAHPGRMHPRPAAAYSTSSHHATSTAAGLTILLPNLNPRSCAGGGLPRRARPTQRRSLQLGTSIFMATAASFNPRSAARCCDAFCTGWMMPACHEGGQPRPEWHKSYPQLANPLIMEWRLWHVSCFRNDLDVPTTSDDDRAFKYVAQSESFSAAEAKQEELGSSNGEQEKNSNDGGWLLQAHKIRENLQGRILRFQTERWTVPWTGKTIAQVMILWIAAFWLVGSWIVPFLAHAAGFSKETLTHRGQALYSLLTDITEGLAGIAILHQCLGRFRPLPPGWFEFNLKGRWILDVAVGCLLFPLVNLLSHINISLVPMSPGPVVRVSSVEQSIVARDPVAMALYAVVVTVCAPIWEEIVFRGFLLPSLTRYMSLPLSILASAAAFALAHFNAQRVMPLIFLGVVMGGVFARSRNLLASMVLHSLWNGFVFLDLMK